MLDLLIPAPVGMTHTVSSAAGRNNAGPVGRATPRTAAQRQWRKDLSAYVGELTACGGRSDREPITKALTAFVSATRALYGLTNAAAERVMFRVRRTVAVAAPHLSRVHEQAEQVFTRSAFAGRRLGHRLTSWDGNAR